MFIDLVPRSAVSLVNAFSSCCSRRVYVRDGKGTHRDEYFMSTDPAMRPEQIVSLYTARWPLETTFQACRARLGLETPRRRCEKSDFGELSRAVLRTTPMLLALYSLVGA